jgi:hypothetical protein
VKAHFTIDGVTYPLQQITTVEMDAALASKKMKDLVYLYPGYFDSLRRVWPIPAKDIVVEFTE